MFSAISSALSAVMPSASAEASPADDPVSATETEAPPKPDVTEESPAPDDAPPPLTSPSASKSEEEPSKPTEPVNPPRPKPKTNTVKAKRGPRRPARRGGGGGRSDASSVDAGDSDDVTSASSDDDAEASSESESEDEMDGPVEADGRSAGDRNEEPQRVVPDDNGIPPVSSSTPAAIKDENPDRKFTPAPAPKAPIKSNTSKSLFPSSATLMDALDNTPAGELEEVNFADFERNGLNALKGPTVNGGVKKVAAKVAGAAEKGPARIAPSKQVGGTAQPSAVATTSAKGRPAPNTTSATASTSVPGPSNNKNNENSSSNNEDKEKHLAEKRARQKEKSKAKRALKAVALKEERRKSASGAGAGPSAAGVKPVEVGSESKPDASKEDDEAAQPAAVGPAERSSKPEESGQTDDNDSRATDQDNTVPSSPSGNTMTPAPLPGASGVGGRLNNRQAYQNRVAADPSFVPRVGKFWTHDQRHYAPGAFGSGGSEYSGLRDMSDYWRGQRGGRGGFRGRGGPGFGRGGPNPFPAGRGGRGGYSGPQQQQQQQQQQLDGEHTSSQQDQTRDAPPHHPGPPPADPAILAIAEPSQTSSPAEVEESRPRKKSDWAGDAGRSNVNSWTHDGFEEMAARERKYEEFAGARGAARGRGRGRGAPARGGFQVQPARGGMTGGHGGYIGGIPGQVDAGGGFASNAIRVKLPGSSGVETASIAAATGSAEANEAPTYAVRPTAERKPSDVIVRLPKAPSIFSPTQEATETSASLERAPEIAPAPTAPSVTSQEAARARLDTPEPSALAANLQLQAEFAALREQQEIMRRREAHLQEEMHRLELDRRRVSSAVNAASETGSIGSGSGSMMVLGRSSAGNPENYLPPGVGMTPTGGFYELATGQPVIFVPDSVSGGPSAAASVAQGQRTPHDQYGRPMLSQQQQRSYYAEPGSSSPDFHANAIPPHLQQQRGSSGAYSTGDGYNATMMTSPYANTPPANLGYFVPPRAGSKIQIRAPDESDNNGGKPSSGKQSQSARFDPYATDAAANPYAQQQLGLAGAMNGQQMQGMAGGRGGYYPNQQQHAYYGQQQGGMAQYGQAAYGEYGYGGEYSGYQ